MSDINEKTTDIINLCRSAVYCEKGEFYPDKNFGSRIHEAKGNERLMLSFIRMALSKLDGVYVKNVTYTKNDNLITVDVLINNAQASASGVPLAEHTLEQFNLAIYSGLYAAFLYMRECYPYLKETKGSVINFASGAGLFGNAGQASYAAAKEGIRGLSRVAATEWGKDGINVNIVCPLAFTTQLENFKAAYPEAYEKNLKAVPAGRFGDPEQDIGRVCVHLGSPDFKYMSGETITLEGGLGQRP